MSTTLNIDLHDDRWTQASLPVRWLLYLQCCLAGTFRLLGFSRAHCGAHYTSLLPTRRRDVVDSSVATAMSAWTQLATCSTAPSTAPSPPASAVQRTWDNRSCEVQADLLYLTRLLIISSVPGCWRHVHLDSAICSVRCRCPALGSNWTMLLSVLLSVCVLVSLSFVSTNVCAEQQSPWIFLPPRLRTPFTTQIHDTNK